jgi:hypothetical protein
MLTIRRELHDVSVIAFLCFLKIRGYNHEHPANR